MARRGLKRSKGLGCDATLAAVGGGVWLSYIVFMTKLELVLERIRQLPQDRQDAIAADLETLLWDEQQETLLTDEQWAEVEAELANPNQEFIPHEQIVAEFEKKYGR